MKEPSKYKLTKKLPTVDVDKSLLKNIETYLLTGIPKLISVSEEEIRGKYYTIIKENSGEFSLGLIENYENDLFPDNTESISVGFRIWDNQKKLDVDIRIRFSEKMYSKIDIEITDINPKEIAVGISTKLEDIIHQKKNLNFFFHPSLFIEISLGLLGYIIPATSAFVFKYNYKIAIGLLIFGVLIASYFWLFKKLKPYSSFNTNRQNMNDKLANYLLLGILSFLIFTTGLTLIRKYLIGQ